jgi:hypothetical protein
MDCEIAESLTISYCLDVKYPPKARELKGWSQAASSIERQLDRQY